MIVWLRDHAEPAGPADEVLGEGEQVLAAR